MTNFAAIKTFGRLSRNEHPVVHAIIGQINVIRKGYVRVNDGVGLSPERHDMGQVGVFNSQCNGSDRGYQFAKVRNITRKNGVRNFWIDVGKNDTGGRSDKRRDFIVFIVVFKAMQDGVIHVITSIQQCGC